MFSRVRNFANSDDMSFVTTVYKYPIILFYTKSETEYRKPVEQLPRPESRHELVR